MKNCMMDLNLPLNIRGNDRKCSFLKSQSLLQYFLLDGIDISPMLKISPINFLISSIKNSSQEFHIDVQWSGRFLLMVLSAYSLIFFTKSSNKLSVNISSKEKHWISIFWNIYFSLTGKVFSLGTSSFHSLQRDWSSSCSEPQFWSSHEVLISNHRSKLFHWWSDSCLPLFALYLLIVGSCPFCEIFPFVKGTRNVLTICRRHKRKPDLTYFIHFVNDGTLLSVIQYFNKWQMNNTSIRSQITR